MRLDKGERRILAVSVCALAIMLVCFAARAVPVVSLAPISPSVETAPADGEESLSGQRVNINTAGLEGLMSLPHIGEVRAKAILAEREANGPFRYPEDLIRVDGIGQRILEELLDYVTTGGEEDAEDLGSG